MEELPDIPEHSSGRMIPLSEVLADRKPSTPAIPPPNLQKTSLSYRKAVRIGVSGGLLVATILAVLYILSK